ncbi:hypothetical protein GDO81_004054 [Engystomops pustulosus]|uniref:Uncharacterized protein n=1 Tax=Engystomops pustulosus TaxID=76066 RepID=A0AAV6ZTG7_ENGPU|nr:hypothetical protein GDO81_004054 [Engystomops pustulosus]
MSGEGTCCPPRLTSVDASARARSACSRGLSGNVFGHARYSLWAGSSLRAFLLPSSLFRACARCTRCRPHLPIIECVAQVGVERWGRYQLHAVRL